MQLSEQKENKRIFSIQKQNLDFLVESILKASLESWHSLTVEGQAEGACEIMELTGRLKSVLTEAAENDFDIDSWHQKQRQKIQKLFPEDPNADSIRGSVLLAIGNAFTQYECQRKLIFS